MVTTKAVRRKDPPNVPTILIDGISFHSEDCVPKWKYVVQRHIAYESIISDQHCLCKVVFDLILTAGLLPTITAVGPFYPKVIQEFIVNLSADLNDRGTLEFQKVHVQGKCLDISPALLNTFLKNALPA